MKTKAYNEHGREFVIDDTNEISRGGEGKIIKLSSTMAAKIYLPGITPISIQKYKSLMQLQNPIFVKPEELLFDVNKNVLGFTMKLINTNDFPLYSIFAPGFANKIRINNKFIMNLFIKLREAIDYAHSKNIIIGDFNPFNILINENGDLHIIDVDSFETPGFPHNGRLLEDIRDYLYNGAINKNSDYFSFAVNLFNALTYMHPYKGINRKIPAFADRMILKKPVLLKDADLIIPKCYSPIHDKNLLKQFERIFINGERFLMSLDNNVSTHISYKPAQVLIKHDKLNIMEILKNETILSISSSDNIMGVVTDKRFILIDVASKGYYRHIYELKTSANIKLFVTDKHAYIFDVDNSKLSHIDINTMIIDDIINIDMKGVLHIKQYNNILVVVKESEIFKLNLSMYIKGNIQISSNIGFGYGFTNKNGLIQNVSGNSHIFYENDNVLNTVKFPYYLKDIIQHKNVGIAMEYKTDKITYSLFRIDGLKVETSNKPINEFRNFAVKENQYVIMPEDDTLVFLRQLDFTELVKYDCKLVDTNTQVFITNAGIVIANANNMYLLNTK